MEGPGIPDADAGAIPVVRTLSPPVGAGIDPGPRSSMRGEGVRSSSDRIELSRAGRVGGRADVVGSPGAGVLA
jgi:hypothetical protein